MDKIMKFINTIIKDAKIKLRKKNGDTDNEPDEEPQGMDEDDENPGNTTLTDGAKDKTAGINKKMVNLVLVGVALTFVVAFLYARSDSKEEETNTDLFLSHYLNPSDPLEQAQLISAREKTNNGLKGFCTMKVSANSWLRCGFHIRF